MPTRSWLVLGLCFLTVFASACTPEAIPAPAPTQAPAEPVSPSSPAASGAASPQASPGAAPSPHASPAAAASAAPTAASQQSAASGAFNGPATRLTLAYSNLIADNLPLWFAKDTGLFERNGLDVDLQYIASTNTMAAVLAGQAQIGSTGGSEVVNSVANGADPVIIATLTPVYSVFLEVRPEIKSAADLKGKKIAITNPGASFDIATRVLLQHEGLDPDTDVTFVKTGSVANVTSALVSGNVDAGLANVPDTLKIEAAGLHPLFDMSKLGLPSSVVILVAQRSYVAANHAAVQRFVDSVVQALARQKQDKPGTVALLQKYLQTEDQAGMAAAYDFYTQSVLPGLPFPKVEQFGDAQRTTAKVNPKAADVRVDSFLDASFVQSAADRGLDKP